VDFFIVGTSRSGSTLVRHMLAAHAEVAVLNESHWVPRLWQTFGDSSAPVDELMAIVAETRWDSGRRVVDVNLEIAGRSLDAVVGRLGERLGASASVAAFHDALVDEIFGARPGAARRGDKTPDYGFYMSMLQEIWPEARFVHVVRNGLDTACSMAGHSGCQLMISAGYDNWVPLSYGRVHERYERRPLPLGAYVGSWERRLARIRGEAARLRSGSYLEVRYERLTEEPAVVASEIAAWLRLESSDVWLELAAGLVRPRPGASRGADTFRSLNVHQLRAVNDAGGVSFLTLPPDAGIDSLEAALRDAGDNERALRAALSVLATRTAESHAQLADRALDLLRKAVAARGEDRAAWALLQSGPRS
jgi:hypothetical protein